LARWAQIEAWITKTVEEKDVWFATLEEIADHMAALERDGIWAPSVEQLPQYSGPILETPETNP
jgi:hypothetical protein